jgi:hypothetical protein
VQPHQTQIACFGASRRRSTLLKRTTYHAPPKRWLSWLVSARKGLRSDSPDDFPFTQSPGSTRGPRRKSARWSDRRPKFRASLNPTNRNPGGTIHSAKDQSCVPGIQRTLNMKTSTKQPQKTQLVSSLPLSPWRSVVVQPSTRAGQFAARRYRVDSALADLIADLAGFGQEAR